MNLARRSRFVYGTTTWETELSARPWIPVDSTVGGYRVSAAGVPCSYIVRRDPMIELTLRIEEPEWPDLLALIAYGETRAQFEWWPDAQETTEPQIVYLESPLAGDRWAPSRMGGYERGMEVTILLRGVASTNPWEPYFDQAGISQTPDVPVPGEPGGPPPIIPEEPPVPPEEVPPPEGLLFFDDFDGGTRAPAQNGVYYTSVEIGGSSGSIAVEADAGSASGYALAFNNTGDPDLTRDNRLEQRMHFPDLTEVWIETLWKMPANYFHRDAIGTDNNKQLRLWDQVYATSGPAGAVVHVGWSTLPKNDGTGRSIVIVEFSQYGLTGTGNWGTGPYTTIFAPGGEYRIGYGVKCASAVGVADGRIVMVINGVKVYDRDNLNIADTSAAPGAINAIRNGYLQGAANSGFTEDTKILLREISVADTIPV